METYFAHGKLLLSAEYAILYGAKGIALPLKKGQRLNYYKKAAENKEAIIRWVAFDQNNYPWFEATFKKSDKSIIKCTYKGAAQTLQKLFKLVPETFFKEDNDHYFETYLEFDKAWGWGTSSTLVSLIAQCTGANPYTLYKSTFKGSGFDLACATAEGPILYQLDKKGTPVIQDITFEPDFKRDIFFVYLGQKENSLKSISKRPKPSADLLNKVDALTADLLKYQDDKESFCKLIEEHEIHLSSYLERPTIKTQLFSKLNASIKSLGAWGGDFVMMIGDSSEIDKLKSEGYNIIFNWDEIVY